MWKTMKSRSDARVFEYDNYVENKALKMCNMLFWSFPHNVNS